MELILALIGLVGFLMAFTNSYDTSLLTGQEAPDQIDNKMRADKAALVERFQVNHNWPASGTTYDGSTVGTHKKLDLSDLPATPTTVAGDLTMYNDNASGEAKRVVQDSLVGARAAEVSFVGVPPGNIMPFMGILANLPNGWLHCDGSSKLQADYPALYAKLDNGAGTCIYGEADGTHFNVPDLQGQFLRGWDNAEGNDPDAATRTDSGDGSTTGDNVGTVQDEEVGPHQHALNTGSDDGDSRVHNAGSTAGTQRNVIASTGSETRPVNIAVMWVIKY